jgi:SpoVK/Ycf46/Vps4 family AAA+-type ATPase
MIGKAMAKEANAKFFSISASSLTSKWHGEGEKLVKTLFQVAAYYQPSIIFIDEIDSLLTARLEGEFEASRRIKTQFFIELDGCNNNSDARILVVGATNRPQELDEAARRRLQKRLYIPLPDAESRRALLELLLNKAPNKLSGGEIDEITAKTAGYSGSDINQLCREAAMGPLRAVGREKLGTINAGSLPPISMIDFLAAMQLVRSSVSEKELLAYDKWNNEFGMFANHRPSSNPSAALAMKD